MELTRRAGSHYIIGYGGTVKIATIDIWSEPNTVGNLVGFRTWSSCWALAGQGQVQLYSCTPAPIPSTQSTTP